MAKPASDAALPSAAAGVDLHLAALATPAPVAESPEGPPAPSTVAKTVSVGKGDTLMKVLTRAGADRRQAHDAITALSEVFNPRKLKAGQEVTLTFRSPEAGEGEVELVGLAVATSVEHEVGARREDDGTFAPHELTKEFTRTVMRGGGEIDDSLYLAARRAGLPVGVLMETIRIFSWDVDFQRDIHPGDSFDVVFEQYRDDDGRPVRAGDVLVAALTLEGKQYKYYRYTPSDDGKVDYFDERGRSARKALLRTPIDGAKLTSRYGKRRHPILGYTRVHRGVDFGAPKGTPIYAAGDGAVEVAGWEGNYGRYVRIRHNSEIKTAYAHMSRIAKGIAKGRRVRQGQVIGYVGSTGLSTGPHLHYEVVLKGRKTNPMGVKLPTGRHLGGKELARFKSALQALETQVASAESLGDRIAEGSACGQSEAEQAAADC